MSDEAKTPGEFLNSNEIASSNESNPPQDYSEHLFECRSCSYVYDYLDGVKRYGIAPGTSFQDLEPDFRCPVCRVKIEAFKDIGPRAKPSGFKENMNYGLGVNKLTSGQKNVLIFGGLAFALACFLSLYSLH